MQEAHCWNQDVQYHGQLRTSTMYTSACQQMHTACEFQYAYQIWLILQLNWGFSISKFSGRFLFGHWALKAAQSSRAFEEMITPKLKEAVVSRGIPDLPDKIHLHGREKRSAFLQDHVNLRDLPSRCSRTKLKCTHCAAIIKSVPKCWMYHCSSGLYNHSPDHTMSLDFRKEWRSLWRGNIHKPQHNHDHNH